MPPCLVFSWAQVKVPPTAPNFWQRVAKLLDNRTANTCQKR